MRALTSRLTGQSSHVRGPSGPASTGERGGPPLSGIPIDPPKSRTHTVCVLLTQLEYFVALAKERHFGRAADACHVSPSTLSEGVQKLEVELGVRLVRRGHAFEGITPEGERLLPWARRMVADQSALRDAARAMDSALTGTLRIGTVPSATASTARLIDRFASAHPRVAVQLETGLPSEEITRRILRFELDAGVLYPVQEPEPDLTVALLYQERQRVVMSAELAAGRRSVCAAELAALPLGLLSASMRGRQSLDEALAERGIALQAQVTADSVEALLALVATGRWAGVLPLPPWAPAVLPGGTRALELVEPTVIAPVVLAALGAEPMSVLARALMQLARDGEQRTAER